MCDILNELSRHYCWVIQSQSNTIAEPSSETLLLSHPVRHYWVLARVEHSLQEERLHCGFSIECDEEELLIEKYLCCESHPTINCTTRNYDYINTNIRWCYEVRHIKIVHAQMNKWAMKVNSGKIQCWPNQRYTAKRIGNFKYKGNLKVYFIEYG